MLNILKNSAFYIRCLQYCVISSAVIYLAGCASPSTLGLNNEQWQRLSPTEQKTYHDNFRSITANLKQQSHFSKKPQQMSDIDDIQLTDVDLTILKGFAAFPPAFNYLPITPVHIHLVPGLCRSATLQAENKNLSTTIWFCYTHKMIGIDPSLYNMNQAWGTAFIDANPLWNQGYTYNHMNTSGYVRLNNASIYIKSESPIDLAPKTVDVTALVTDQAASPNNG